MKGILKIGPKKFEIKIVKFTIELKKEGIEYALRDQLLHSGTSVRADEEKLKQAVREESKFDTMKLHCDQATKQKIG